MKSKLKVKARKQYKTLRSREQGRDQYRELDKLERIRMNNYKQIPRQTVNDSNYKYPYPSKFIKAEPFKPLFDKKITNPQKWLGQDPNTNKWIYNPQYDAPPYPLAIEDRRIMEKKHYDDYNFAQYKGYKVDNDLSLRDKDAYKKQIDDYINPSVKLQRQTSGYFQEGNLSEIAMEHIPKAIEQYQPQLTQEQQDVGFQLLQGRPKIQRAASSQYGQWKPLNSQYHHKIYEPIEPRLVRMKFNGTTPKKFKTNFKSVKGEYISIDERVKRPKIKWSQNLNGVRERDRYPGEVDLMK